MTEILTEEHSYEYYTELARTASKVGNDDERVVTYLEAVGRGEEVKKPSHGQFGNNFYLLFLARRRADDPEDILVKVYLKRAEALGIPWGKFLADNQSLIQEIDQSLDGTKPYKDLLRYYIQLLKQKRNEDADRLDSAAGDPLGIEGLGMFAWDRINPLLEKAAEKMRKVGIEPEQFFS